MTGMYRAIYGDSYAECVVLHLCHNWQRKSEEKKPAGICDFNGTLVIVSVFFV